MFLSLDNILQYSKCPRQFSFLSENSVPLTTEDKIYNTTKDIIKQAYINRSQHNYNPQWETIKSRVNKVFFFDVDINNKELFDKAYKDSLRVLGILQYWYSKFFLNDKSIGITNLELSIQVSRSTIKHTVDLVLLDGQNSGPVVFNDPGVVNDYIHGVYNSIYHKGILWLLYRETNEYLSCLHSLTINERSVIFMPSYITKASIDKAGKYIHSIVENIEKGNFYPSVSEQCMKCPFKNRCSI